MDAVTLTVDRGLAVLRLGRAHGNAINPELVEGLIVCAARVAADDGVRGVLLAASGKLFSPGLDLAELSELDRPAMEHFLTRFNLSLAALYGLEKPLVAAIQGHAVAGGCVLALTADWRVLRRGALVGLNEVKVGVPLPFGVALMLREAVSGSRMEEVALFGRNYQDDAAVAAGLASELHEALGFEAHCLVRLDELASKDPRAFALTKRYLRSATIERIRAHETALASEFLDAWFSPSTRERVAGIVRDLASRRS